MVHLANIKFGDLGRKTDWRIFSLANKLIHFRSRDIKLMAAETYEQYESEQCVRGHHIYKREWVPFIGEELLCHREIGNISDPYAVAVLKRESSQVVGHVPRKISATCSLFLDLGGTIDCKITGPRRHSSDLPQGGLEVPCKFIFKGGAKYVSKVAKLIKPFEMTKRKYDKEGNEEAQASKRYKDSIQNSIINVEEMSTLDDLPGSEQWVKLNRQVLLDVDKEIVLKGLFTIFITVFYKFILRPNAE